MVATQGSKDLVMPEPGKEVLAIAKNAARE
jgi:hypothetical protein